MERAWLWWEKGVAGLLPKVPQDPLVTGPTVSVCLPRQCLPQPVRGVLGKVSGSARHLPRRGYGRRSRCSRYGVKGCKAAPHPLEERCTTPIRHFEAEEGDLLIAMEPAHLDAVERQHWPTPHQITLLGLWIDGHGAVISDAFGDDEAAFDDCFSLIESSVSAMTEQTSRS